jgi:glycosyltransferase involved in cell wall biosynthesis
MIDVVLPCLNEAAALPWVLSRMPDGYRAIVADNGSTDGSAAVAAHIFYPRGVFTMLAFAVGFALFAWATG